MSNFITAYEEGQKGLNKGLFMGKGLENLDKALGSIQKQRVYVVGGGPKAGKTTFVNYAFLIGPYLYSLEHNIPVEWIYFSFEIDRISMEFDIASTFLYLDFGISEIKLEDGTTFKNKNTVSLSSKYLRGRLKDDNDNVIKVSKDIEDKLKIVYRNRITKLFGEYNRQGEQIEKGVVTFIEDSDNPTGLNKFLVNHAKQNGSFSKSSQEFNNRTSNYVPNNPEKFTIVITDHIRRLREERGYNMKQLIDKYSEYTVDLKNITGYSFVHIIHLNRDLADIQRQKAFGDRLYPNPETIKDSGNLSEDCDELITLFNPNDQRYNLEKHFGRQIKASNGDELFPGLRTIHLVESRHNEYPQHFATIMNGENKTFKQL